MIGSMSCLAMWIPRATMFTDMASAWWVSVPLAFHCALFWLLLTFAEAGSFSNLLAVSPVTALCPSSCSYFAVVIFKFLILMLEEVGGDEAFLRRAPKHQVKISTGPCCCCCLCLPYVTITR